VTNGVATSPIATLSVTGSPHSVQVKYNGDSSFVASPPGTPASGRRSDRHKASTSLGLTSTAA